MKTNINIITAGVFLYNSRSGRYKMECSKLLFIGKCHRNKRNCSEYCICCRKEIKNEKGKKRNKKLQIKIKGVTYN